MVYKNFEKNYKTHRMACSGDADESEPALDASTISTVTKATTSVATEATKSNSSSKISCNTRGSRGRATTIVAATALATTRLAPKAEDYACGQNGCGGV